MSQTIEKLAVTLSSDELRPVAPPRVALSAASMAGALSALGLAATYLGIRPDIDAVLAGHDHVVFAKLLFALGMIAVALPLLCDLSIPGRHVGFKMAIAVIPILTIAVLSGLEAAFLPVREWMHPLEHGAWFECLWKIPMLAVPAFVMLALALRRQAPTNLVRTGAFLGLASGGIGALGYALHCHDDSVTFVALAYSLSVSLMVALGAITGPRLLRWR